MDASIRKVTRGGFTIIQNSLSQNENLSWEQRGMLLYLLSLPENFKIHKTYLHKKSKKNGRDASIRVFDELVAMGYITEEFDKGKNPPERIYTVYDESILPIHENQESVSKPLSSRIPENQYTENQYTENQGLINTIEKNSIYMPTGVFERFKVYNDVNYSDSNYIILTTGLDTGIIITEFLFLDWVNHHQQRDLMGWKRNYDNVNLETCVSKFFLDYNNEQFESWKHTKNAFKRYLRRKPKKESITPIREQKPPKTSEITQEMKDEVKKRASSRFQ